MRIRIDAGVLHAEGTATELADYTRALGLHRSDVSVVRTETNQPSEARDFGALPPADDLRRKVLAIPQKEVEDWLRANPKGNVRTFLADKVNMPMIARMGGLYRPVVISTYNRLSRTRRKLGLPPPTKGD